MDYGYFIFVEGVVVVASWHLYLVNRNPAVLLVSLALALVCTTTTTYYWTIGMTKGLNRPEADDEG